MHGAYWHELIHTIKAHKVRLFYLFGSVNSSVRRSGSPDFSWDDKELQLWTLGTALQYNNSCISRTVQFVFVYLQDI